MDEERTFCADSPYGDSNCQYAMVVKEEGEFPVMIRRTEIRSDGKEESCVISDIETCRNAVYCMHPNCGKLFIGTVEPYGGICEVPSNCPEKGKKSKRTLIQCIKDLFP